MQDGITPCQHMYCTICAGIIMRETDPTMRCCPQCDNPIVDFLDVGEWPGRIDGDVSRPAPVPEVKNPAPVPFGAGSSGVKGPCLSGRGSGPIMGLDWSSSDEEEANEEAPPAHVD